MPLLGIVAAAKPTVALPPPANPARFVAVGNDGAGPVLITTENNNATTWIDRSVAVSNISPNAVLFDVTYSASLDRWVAVGYKSASNFGDPVVIYSNNGGNTWTVATPAPTTNFMINGVCWTGAAFIAVGNDSTVTNPRVMTSSDGITWTARTSAPTSTVIWQAVMGYSGLAVAVGGVDPTSSPSKIMTSANDGASWTARTAAGADFLNDVYATSGVAIVAVGFDVSTNRMSSSPDGITWSNVTGVSGHAYYGIAYNGTIFVAVGMDTSTTLEARIATSPTTPVTTWTNRTPAPTTAPPDGINLLSVAAGVSGGFVAVGRDNNTFTIPHIMFSADGITWTARTPPIAAGDGGLFGVGAKP